MAVNWGIKQQRTQELKTHYTKGDYRGMKKESKNLKSITERNSNDKSHKYITDNIEKLNILYSIKYKNYKYFIGDIKINWNQAQNEHTINALLRGINLLIVQLMPHDTGLTINKIDVTKKVKTLIAKLPKKN